MLVVVNSWQKNQVEQECDIHWHGLKLASMFLLAETDFAFQTDSMETEVPKFWRIASEPASTISQCCSYCTVALQIIDVITIASSTLVQSQTPNLCFASLRHPPSLFV